MQNPSLEKMMHVKIVFPDEDSLSVDCDSLHVPMADDRFGRLGGQYGIKKGHADAVIALGQGQINCLLSGKSVWERDCKRGFVKIIGGQVTIVLN